MREHTVVMHAFSTRLGGMSESPYATLNLGFGSGDDRTRVEANRAQFGRALGIDPSDLVALRQVHGNRIIVLTEANDPQLVRGTPGDGLITDRTHLPLAVITADCFPVVLAAPTLPAVGIVHSGRKGTAARVVPAAIARLCQEFHVPPEAVWAVIGPGIGRCCYEVDDATAAPFQAQFAPSAAVYWRSRPGHLYLDLQQAILHQIHAAGVESTHVWCADLCTACHPQWFYSYRREGPRSGRMLNVVMIQSNTAPASP
ncbi:MAG TPA: peptidoglycan editing factor PgeF [Candidatus Tectomicrobia bacterium]|nr:peptidoglycan editing factor PgeF [Candidatus Tectomicrobia bacterium]